MQNLSVIRFFAFIQILLLPLIGFPQWERSSGLEGAEITAMVSAEPYLFAACLNHGVYRLEKGEAWALIDDGTPYKKIAKAGNCLFIYDTYYYGLGCKRSFDYGETWEYVPTLNNAWHIYAIDTTIFFYSGSSLIKRSIDFGNSYDTIILPDEIEHVSDFLCDDSLLYIHDYDSDKHSLFYSNDLGQTWDSISTQGLFPEVYASVEEIKYLNGTWWAQTETLSAPYTVKQVFVFSLDQHNWMEVTGELPKYWEFGDLFEFNEDIFCSYETYPVCKFNSKDSLWMPFTDDSKSVNQFLVHNNELFCATAQGAYSLDTNGIWNGDNIGLNFRSISSIDVNTSKLYITANNELYSSEDDGSSFTISPAGSGHQVIATDSVLYVISAADFKISRDDGISWYTYNDGIEYHHYQKLIHLSITPEFYFISTYQGIYRSPVNQISWIKLENGPFNIQMTIHNIEAIDSTVIAGANYPPHDLFLSTNHGDLFADYGEYCEFQKLDQAYYLLKDSIFYSDDMAQSWNHIPNDYDHIYYCIERSNDTVLLGGRNASGDPVILLSYNLGSNWIDVWDNLPFQMYIPGIVKNLKQHGNRLLAGNPQNGLWYRDDLLVVIAEQPAASEWDQCTFEIYPNPTHDYINIAGLDSPGRYRLFDLKGQAVQTGTTESDRIYVTSLPTGLYILEIELRQEKMRQKILKY